MRRVLVLLLLLIGPPAPLARAQSFGPPVRTERLLVLLGREGNARFTLSAYYAQWQIPFKVDVSTDSARHGRVSRTIRTIADTPASPLVEASYLLSRRWNVGFWYNPIRGERLHRKVTVVDTPVTLSYQRDTDIADLHVTYSGPHGLSAQLGYYVERGAIKDLRVTTLPAEEYTLGSWNLWLTQRLDAVSRHGLVIDRLTAEAIPFVSVGYHTASSLRRTASLQLGLAITYRDRLSLAASVWFFDVGGPLPATRVTAGLVYRR